MTNKKLDSIVDKVLIAESGSKRSQKRRSTIIWWAVGAFLYAFLGTVVIGTRSDLSQVSKYPIYWIHLALLFITAFAALSNAIYYSKPRPFLNSKLLSFGVLSLIIWLIFVLVAPMPESIGNYYQFPPDVGFGCMRNILLFGFIPGVFLLIPVRSMFPTQLRLAAFFLVLFGSLVGTMANHFSCSTDQFFHIVIFHFSPVLLASLFGYVVLSRWLKW